MNRDYIEKCKDYIILQESYFKLIKKYSELKRKVIKNEI